jgi:hypothetical protein
MMWALKVTRSTMAATRRVSGTTWPHSLKGRFERFRLWIDEVRGEGADGSV